MNKRLPVFIFSLAIAVSLIPFQSSKAEELSSKLKGRILLQVESKGEAWYVNPKDSKRYYMANGLEAYNIMRNLGVGVTNSNLEKIKSDKTFAKKNSGKIFLQVESKGEAYYIDVNGIAHYLKDGEAAYGVMRELGLGIKTADLNKIEKSLIVSKADDIKTTPAVFRPELTWAWEVTNSFKGEYHIGDQRSTTTQEFEFIADSAARVEFSYTANNYSLISIQLVSEDKDDYPKILCENHPVKQGETYTNIDSNYVSKMIVKRDGVKYKFKLFIDGGGDWVINVLEKTYDYNDANATKFDYGPSYSSYDIWKDAYDYEKKLMDLIDKTLDDTEAVYRRHGL